MIMIILSDIFGKRELAQCYSLQDLRYHDISSPEEAVKVKTKVLNSILRLIQK